MKKMYSLCGVVLMMVLLCPMAALSAVPVTSGLVLQLDTSDVTTDGSGNVTSWNDQSGNDNDALQATSGLQPILVDAITPARGSAVRFDGTDDYLEMAPDSTFDGGTWTMFAVYAVDAFDGTSGGKRIINLGYADIDPNEAVTKAHPTVYTIIAGGSTGGVRATSRTITGTGIFVSSGIPAGYATDTFYTGVATMDSVSTNVTAYLINHAGTVTTASLPNGTAVGSGNNVARIGAGTVNTAFPATPSAFFNGWVSEILVYNRVLTSQEITDVSAYLDSRHLVPAMASNPNPANGGYSYDQLTTLEWTPVSGATSQTIYFSTVYNDVNDLAPAALEATLAGDADSCEVEVKMSTTYYWRVNHVVGGSPVYGPIWSFSVPAYYAIDNFERYTGTGSSSTSGTLRYVWKDGYSLAGEGLSQLGSNVAQVSSTATPDMFTETTDEVRTLTKSMLFAFDNTGNQITFTYPSSASAIYTPVYPYAEAKVSLGSLPIGTDWTKQGDWTVYLYFYGKTTNATNSPLYLVVEDATGHICTPIVYPTSSHIAEASWHTWTISTEELATNGVDLSNLSKLYIGFGDRNNPQVGGKGTVYFDDIRLHREATIATDLNKDCTIDILDFSILAADWLGHAGCSN